MPEIVFDTCVLSNFALSRSFYLLESLYHHQARVTSFVAAENLKGIQAGYRDLAAVNQGVEAGWLREVSLKGKKENFLFETLTISLGLGEASSIAVAKVRGWVFASDDRAARKEAALQGVPMTGTLGILCKIVRKKILALPDGEAIFRRMREKGFYSPVTSLRDLL